MVIKARRLGHIRMIGWLLEHRLLATCSAGHAIYSGVTGQMAVIWLHRRGVTDTRFRRLYYMYIYLHGTRV